MQLRAFLAALAPVAARQPQVFVEAGRATVDLQGAHLQCTSRTDGVCLLQPRHRLVSARHACKHAFSLR